jgi:hypothetical protein
MVKENPVKDRVMRAMRERGAYVAKVHGSRFGNAGVPDLLICYRSIFIGMEIKSPSVKLKPSPRQELHLQQIARAQGIACLVNSVKMARSVLDNIDKTIAGIPVDKVEGEKIETESKKNEGDADGDTTGEGVDQVCKEV